MRKWECIKILKHMVYVVNLNVNLWVVWEHGLTVSSVIKTTSIYINDLERYEDKGK